MISRETVQAMRKMDAEGVPRKDIAKRIGCCLNTVIKYCGVKCSQRAKMAVERKASIIASLAEASLSKSLRLSTTHPMQPYGVLLPSRRTSWICHHLQASTGR